RHSATVSSVPAIFSNRKAPRYVSPCATQHGHIPLAASRFNNRSISRLIALYSTMPSLSCELMGPPLVSASSIAITTCAASNDVAHAAPVARAARRRQEQILPVG